MRYSECPARGFLHCDCLILSLYAMELLKSLVNVDCFSPGVKKARRDSSKFEQEWKEYGIVWSTRGPAFAKTKCLRPAP